jgi:beta-lactamase regulating signal transducer with metallopeptidase domain
LLLQIGLSNAVVATGLALVAAVVGWLGRRPALTHGLWLLVLLKLTTPSLWPVKISWPANEEPEAVAVRAQPAVEPVELSTLALPAEALEDNPETEVVPPSDEELALAEPPPAVEATAAETPPVAEPPAPIVAATPGVAWQVVVGGIWLAGASLWFLVAAWRIHQFRRLLRFARPAPSGLEDQVQRLAERLGLKRCPGVWMVPGSVSPMLWAIAGSPRLLVPSALWERLSEDQRATLLIHELAHLRRGDHWVRRLEFVATGLFWWHPVVWWARREVRIAEEECCDAWVVWALPGAVRDYALALMETVDFLSEVRTVLPPAVSGIGHVQLLRRRLAMIMLGTNSRALSGAGFAGLVVLGALVLPLLPTWAQEPRARDEAKKQVTEDKKAEEPRVIVLQGEVAKSDQGQIVVRLADDKTGLPKKAPAGLDDAKDEVELLQAQLEVKRAELQEGEARLKQAAQRLERVRQLSAKGAISEGEVAKLKDDVELAQAQLEPKRAQVREAEVRLVQAKRRLARFQQAGAPVDNKARAVQPPPTPKRSQARAAAEEEQRQLEEMLKQLLDSKGDLSAATKERILAKVRAQRDAQIHAEKARAEAEKAKADAAQAYEQALRLAEQLKSGQTANLESLHKKLAEEQKLRAEELATQARKALGDQKKRVENEAQVKKPAGPGGQSTTDSQLQDLQKKVDALTREMEALRKELQKLTGPKQSQASPNKRDRELFRFFGNEANPQSPIEIPGYQLVPVPGSKGTEYKLVPKPNSDPRSVPAIPLTPKKEDKKDG